MVHTLYFCGRDDDDSVTTQECLSGGTKGRAGYVVAPRSGTKLGVSRGDTCLWVVSGISPSHAVVTLQLIATSHLKSALHNSLVTYSPWLGIWYLRNPQR